MNISNSANSASPFGQISTTKVNNNVNTPIKETGYSADINKAEQEQSSNKQVVQGIVLDEQAMALFKENQTLEPSSHNDNTTFATQERSSLKNEKTRLRLRVISQ